MWNFYCLTRGSFLLEDASRTPTAKRRLLDNAENMSFRWKIHRSEGDLI